MISALPILIVTVIMAIITLVVTAILRATEMMVSTFGALAVGLCVAVVCMGGILLWRRKRLARAGAGNRPNDR